jgi:predicted O-methyltransferase YrrM
MSRVPLLLSAYESRGYGIRTGLNPAHFKGRRIVSFTQLYEEDSLRRTGGGLTLQECYLIETLATCIEPKRIFGIGNAFSWSTILLSLVFPEAQVVVIDNLSEGSDARAGFDLTRSIAAELELRVELIDAASPGDVAAVVHKHLGEIDLALIDGLHTNAQQWVDYTAIKPLLAKDAAVLFHDVLDWGMTESFGRICADWPGPSTLLHRTPSGMGLLHSDGLSDALAPIHQMFVERRLDDFAAVSILEDPGGKKARRGPLRSARKRIKRLLRPR